MLYLPKIICRMVSGCGSKMDDILVNSELSELKRAESLFN